MEVHRLAYVGAIRNSFYFRQGDGRELWRSDGTVAGTAQVEPALVDLQRWMFRKSELLVVGRRDDGRLALRNFDGTLASGQEVVDLTSLGIQRPVDGSFFPTQDGFSLVADSGFPPETSILYRLPKGLISPVAQPLRSDDRFEVRVRWRKADGEAGFGVPERLTADTGSFYFFRLSNAELMVKILDGRNANGHFWAFYGALSNLRYTITVTDTATGAVKVYENAQGSFASVGDTQAFAAP